jgi:hypothetical protein
MLLLLRVKSLTTETSVSLVVLITLGLGLVESLLLLIQFLLSVSEGAFISVFAAI